MEEYKLEVMVVIPEEDLKVLMAIEDDEKAKEQVRLYMDRQINAIKETPIEDIKVVVYVKEALDRAFTRVE